MVVQGMRTTIGRHESHIPRCPPRVFFLHRGVGCDCGLAVAEIQCRTTAATTRPGCRGRIRASRSVSPAPEPSPPQSVEATKDDVVAPPPAVTDDDDDDDDDDDGDDDDD